MRLYHFAATHMVDGIRREGLTKGGILAPDQRSIRSGWQWLTDDPSWDAQGWATMHHIDYDRSASRFEVEIPTYMTNRLHRWVRVAPLLGYEAWWLTEFHRVGGSEHWYVFSGDVRPDWMSEPEYKPALATAAASQPREGQPS